MRSKKIKRTVIFFLGLVLLLSVLPFCCTFRISDSKAVREFKEQGLDLKTNTLEPNGNALHYVSCGNDSLPALVFIHGSPGGWHDYALYLDDKELLSHFRIIAVDRPGFGYSNYGQAYHLQQQADIVSSMLRELNNEKPVHLVGHSLGGPLVALLAADNQDNITSIIILSGALDPALEPEEKWRKWLDVFPLRCLMPGALKQSNRELIYCKPDLELLKAKFPQIRCNVMIMHGEKDMLVDVGNVKYMKEQFTNAASIWDTIFPGENHFIPWTKTGEIKKLLLNLQK